MQERLSSENLIKAAPLDGLCFVLFLNVLLILKIASKPHWKKPKKSHTSTQNLRKGLENISYIAAKNWFWVRHTLDCSQEMWGLLSRASEAWDPETEQKERHTEMRPPSQRKTQNMLGWLLTLLGIPNRRAGASTVHLQKCLRKHRPACSQMLAFPQTVDQKETEL